MSDSQIPKNDKLLETARKLRREMTRHERHLWYDFLRTYPIKIYKQRIIGNYIADFYCASAKLVIELDGSQHFTDEGIENDQIRDEFMRELGLTILRFTNFDIDRNFINICNQIDSIIKEKINDQLRFSEKHSRF